MNAGPPGWLLPSALVTYVALAVLERKTGTARWLGLLWPFGLAVLLGLAHRGHRALRLVGSETSTRAVLFGAALYGAAFGAEHDSAALEAARSLALLAVTVGALLAIARVDAPRGLVSSQRVARSLDAVGLGTAIWSLTGSAALARALFPEIVLLDPDAFDATFVFSVIGSLLLLSAAEIRVILLRGLELGVLDRARSSLAIGIAGVVVALGSALLGVASVDRALGATLVVTACAVCATKLVPSASRVTRTVRAVLALAVLGAPVALGGAHFALHLPSHPVSIALLVSGASVLVGLVARSLAAPLGPEGSRWLVALDEALDAALHPEPDVALRDALGALRRVEPRSKNRPELYRADPGAMLSVDVAGYLSIEPVVFPRGVLDLALGEPELTLRRETVERAEVRDPKVRPVSAWFSAHDMKTVTALVDDEGGVGFLALPRGGRTSHLSLEEAEALARLGRRIGGLLAVNAALARSRERELATQKTAERSLEEAEGLRAQLAGTERAHVDEAETLVEVLRVAGHGPASQIRLREIERLVTARGFTFVTPPGVDPRPWAAYHHLARPEPQGPFVVFDGHQKNARDPATYSDDRAIVGSPVRRALGGTLLLRHVTGLPEGALAALARSLERSDVRVVLSRDPNVETPAPLAGLVGNREVTLPTLEERAEDLRSLVVFELSRIGLTLRGHALGLDRSSLVELHERSFPGNEDELRALLLAAATRATGDVITARDLRATEDEPVPPASEPVSARSRARRPPRARRT